MASVHGTRQLRVCRVLLRFKRSPGHIPLRDDQVAGGLDTHFDDWESDQGPRQESELSSHCKYDERTQNTEYKGTGSSWLDHTVIRWIK